MKAHKTQATWLKAALTNEVHNLKLLERQQRMNEIEEEEGERRQRQKELQAREACEQKRRALLIDEAAKEEMREAAKMIEEARLAEWSIKEAKQGQVVMVQRQTSQERVERKKEANVGRQTKAAISKFEQFRAREELNIQKHQSEHGHEIRVERQRSIERDHHQQLSREAEINRKHVIDKANYLAEERRAAVNTKVLTKSHKVDVIQREQRRIWDERHALQTKVDEIYHSVKEEVYKQQVLSRYDVQSVQERTNMLVNLSFRSSSAADL